MARFLVDEDLPRSLAALLRAAGIAAEDVRDLGLRGKPDDEIFAYATAHGLALLTADVGFGNLLRFPLGTHVGIVVARFPNEVPTVTLNQAILHAVQGLSDEETSGSLVMIEPGRLRLRRKG
jgi:predicted nuclease of predicted toxin-antitoxin system